MLSTNIALLVGIALSVLLGKHLYKVLSNKNKTIAYKVLWSFLTILFGAVILLFVMPFIQVALQLAGI